ncbi:hypothetical protein EAKF1_ch1697 [Escherichia albertii KF1]|nr:hypothetical protein EAKF1_ch1697 [Escherichia albertii KF1]
MLIPRVFWQDVNQLTIHIRLCKKNIIIILPEIQDIIHIN